MKKNKNVDLPKKAIAEYEYNREWENRDRQWQHFEWVNKKQNPWNHDRKFWVVYFLIT